MEPADSRIDLYQALARLLRADSIRCSTAAGSGHLTSSLSAADLMAVLKACGEALAAAIEDLAVVPRRERDNAQA